MVQRGGGHEDMTTQRGRGGREVRIGKFNHFYLCVKMPAAQILAHQPRAADTRHFLGMKVRQLPYFGGKEPSAHQLPQLKK